MIARRLKKVRKVVLVLSGKGGGGKSGVSATLAVRLAQGGHAVGLLDADLYGPSSAILFGDRHPPREGAKGLVPPRVRNVRLMSVDLFAPGEKMPLTGKGAWEVLTEMLALTSWGELDYLVVDMPPATGDIAMLFTSLRQGGLVGLVVTTPDRLSFTVAHRTMQLLHEGRVPVAGVVGNAIHPAGGAGRRRGRWPEKLAEEFGDRFLGSIPYDAGVLRAIESGGMEELLGTHFSRRVLGIAKVLSGE